MAPGNLPQKPLHSLPTAHLHRTVSLSGSLTDKEITCSHPSCKCNRGVVEARGDELILPVSFLVARENVMDKFHIPLISSEDHNPPRLPNVTVLTSVVLVCHLMFTK